MIEILDNFYEIKVFNYLNGFEKGPQSAVT